MAQPATAELDLGPSVPGRPLVFSAASRGHYFIDIFGGHVFEIRRHQCSDRIVWSTTITPRGSVVGEADAFATLGAAEDHLQAEAVRRGGAA